MFRLDSRISLMIATEEEAEAVEKALKNGPLPVMTSDDVQKSGENLLIILLDESEVHASEAEAILNK